jgi:hypothetical protein
MESMQKAAKEKSFILWIVATVALCCAPSLASSIDVEHGKNRVEIFLGDGQNRVEPSTLSPAIASSYYDSASEAASESSVAPRRAVTGMDNRAYSSLAEQQYDAIRALRRSDIDTVSKNTGLSVAEVTTMKKHLFFGKHERFAPEVGKVIRKRFDANDEVAEAWIRAQNGPLNARQQDWFRKLADHELAERTLMGQGMPFQDLSAWQRVSGQWEHVFREGLQGAHELAPRTPKFWPFFE